MDAKNPAALGQGLMLTARGGSIQQSFTAKVTGVYAKQVAKACIE
jgi:hypothetical protein